MIPHGKQRDVVLHGLPPRNILDILDKLDLDRPGLVAAKTAADQGDRAAALMALLHYFREKYPLPEPATQADQRTMETADHIVRHIVQWGPYEPADYGPEIAWLAEEAGAQVPPEYLARIR